MANPPADYWVTSLQFTPKTYQNNYPAIDPTNPDNSLAGKVVIITGASRGIGAKGIAPAFAKASPKGLVLVATGASTLAKVEAEVKNLNPSVRTLAVPTDISNAAAVDSLFSTIKSTFDQHADVLVINAAVNKGEAVIHHNDPEVWWSNFEVNTKGTFLLTRSFISSLPSPDTPAAIVSLTTMVSYKVLPMMTGYGISKLAAQQLIANIAAQNANVTAVNVHPGLYDTDSLLDAFRVFNLDDPSLIGGTAVWLSAKPERSKFLSGRVISANWDVNGLQERKEEIVKEDLLVIDLKGKFGKEQFIVHQ